MTEAEQLLWYRVRKRQIAGRRFRRQVPIGNYVVDFLCLESRLIVELDGSQHLDSRQDRARDAWLEAQGYRVLRFWNHDALDRTDEVLAAIVETLIGNRPLPAFGHLAPQAGEGRAGEPAHGELAHVAEAAAGATVRAP